MTDPRYSEVCARLKILAVTAAGMIPTKLPLEPTSSDMREIIKDLEVIARDVDALIAAYGSYIAANVSGYVDQSLFKDQLGGALEGNALYTIEEAAEMLAEEMSEAV